MRYVIVCGSDRSGVFLSCREKVFVVRAGGAGGGHTLVLATGKQ